MKSYIVKPGDTLTRIAREQGVTLKALTAANRQLRYPDRIAPGMALNLPELDRAAPEPAAPVEPRPSLRAVPAEQRGGGKDGAPQVVQPVNVSLSLPVYYVTERGPIESHRPIYCGRAFADTVLAAFEGVLAGTGWGVAHVGVYFARHARHKDGSLIKPARWSNHAYGEAWDFKGLVTAQGHLIGIRQMRQEQPDTLEGLLKACERAIVQAGRKPEIVDEGGWVHIGLWPAH